MNTIKMQLAKGGELEIDMTEEFLSAVRKVNSPPSEIEPTHQEIIDFIYAMFSEAINNSI